MSTSVIIELAALIGAPLFAYFGVARRASGKIGTSEASELWAESRAIREWATSRIRDLNQLVAHLEKKVEDLERDHAECQEQNLALMRRVAELEGASRA